MNGGNRLGIGILPDGLYEFLKSKGHVLIKGDPGTGKTTLALELLRMLGVGGKGVYLSTRVSPSKLYVQFPWLEEIVKPEHLVSTTYAPDEIKFDDVRLGDAKYILKKILDAIEALKTPIIVFDAWDVLVKEVEVKERAKIEKIIMIILDASDACTIFVSEEPMKTSMDYLVDGIVTLSQSELNGRRIRDIELNKLRGKRISHHRLLFTLNDGRFRCFPAYKRKTVEKTRKWKLVPDSKDYFSTGSEDLDKVLGGGYPRGSYVVLEADANVPISAIGDVTYCVIRNFLSQNRGVTCFPIGGSSSRVIESHIAPYIERNRLGKYLRIYEIANGTKGQAKPYVVPLSAEADVDADYKLWIETQDELRERTGQQILKSYGLDSLESRYIEEPEKFFKAVNDDIINCIALGGLVLSVASSGLTITRRAVNMAAVHLKMVMEYGSIIIYGVKPETILNVLETDVSMDYPQIRLTPIV
jgi:KaiC/GvpD/RAD55 family RecA-like ATPase